VIILDLNVDDVNGSVQVSSSVQEVFGKRKERTKGKTTRQFFCFVLEDTIARERGRSFRDLKEREEEDEEENEERKVGWEEG